MKIELQHANLLLSSFTKAAESLYKSISQSNNMYLLINWYTIMQKAVITLQTSEHTPAGQNSAWIYKITPFKWVYASKVVRGVLC